MNLDHSFNCNPFFLKMLRASPNDADQIFKAIDWRVQQLHMKEQKSESEAGKHTEVSASTC